MLQAWRLFLCFILGHDIGLLGQFTVCRRCGRDARPDWMIQMETEDRLEALVVKKLFPPPGPKDWSPRTGRCVCARRR